MAMVEGKEDFSASIDYVAIDIDSGTTVSGTTQVPQAIYRQAQPERDMSASRLIIEKDKNIRQAEAILPEVVNRVLENKNTSAYSKGGNVFLFVNSNFYGSAVGGDVREANITLINEWHEVKNEIDMKKLLTEFEEVIHRVQEQAKEDEQRTDLANITLARDELNKADGPAMLKYLKKIGEFSKEIIIEIGAETLKKIITGS